MGSTQEGSHIHIQQSLFGNAVGSYHKLTTTSMKLHTKASLYYMSRSTGFFNFAHFHAELMSFTNPVSFGFSRPR